MRIWTDRAGITPGDALLVLATLSLAFALAYPRLERKATRDRAEAVAQLVEDVEAAAARFRQENDHWPPPAEAGTVPEGLGGYLPADAALSGTGYVLKWDRWESVESTPPPPSPDIAEPNLLQGEPPPPPPPDSVTLAPPTVVARGAVTVQSDDPRILAILLERFGVERSFLRDGSWVLMVLGEPAESD